VDFADVDRRVLLTSRADRLRATGSNGKLLAELIDDIAFQSSDPTFIDKVVAATAGVDAIQLRDQWDVPRLRGRIEDLSR
jgi:hypothetical protein